MASINLIRGSDGTGNASVATVQSTRAPAATTIVVDTVDNIPATFMGSMGTPHTFVDPVTSETITIISEATAVDFTGHVDGSNLEIDSIAPGYTDLGSEVGDIVIIKPTSQWADNVADTLAEAHNDDGSLADDSVGRDNVTDGQVPVLREVRTYPANNTWNKPAGMVGNGFVIVEVVGGGGGSGGADNDPSKGGGGGGGEWGTKKIAAASLGSTETVTVGAGGTAGADTGAGTGGTGGTSSFGSHVTAIGGSGGTGSSSGGGNGGDGGTGGTGADMAIPGGDGFRGDPDVHGGEGGASHLSNMRGSNVTGGTGNPGKLYGGGASGAAANSSTNRAGAVGGAGIVIVREYY